MSGLVDRAFAFMEQAEWGAAREVLTEAVRRGPCHAQLHEALGTACYRLEDRPAAATAFARALALEPENIELLVQTALVRLELGNRASAEALLRRASALAAGNPTVVKLLARCQEQKAAEVPAAPVRMTRDAARNQLREVTCDDGLTADIGDFTYVHGGRIRNPSGARTHLRIGKFCSIATDLTIIGYNHRTDWISTYPFLDQWHREVWTGTDAIPHPATPELGGNLDRGDIVIGSDVWIGCDVKLFKGVKIGHGAVIGACSLVTKDVPPYTVVAGVPARPIRRRFNDDQCRTLLEMAWWDWSEEEINRRLPYLCSGRLEELGAMLRAEAAVQPRPAPDLSLP